MANPFDMRVDVLILCIVLLVCAAWMRQVQERTPEPVASPLVTPGSTAAGPRADPAPADTRWAAPFELPRVDGEAYRYNGKTGPFLITLTATGCAGCVQRIALDRQAVTAAHQRSVPVLNIFVYSSPESGRSFRSQHNPDADDFLADPTGQVSVNQYGGSDASCWILVDRNGRIVWQGGGNLSQLEGQLARL